jgi:hypothetical protein
MTLTAAAVFCLGLAPACLIGGAARAQDYQITSTGILLEIMPDDVGSYVERADACLHWLGAASLNQSRKQEIDAKLTRLRCSDLGKDHTGLAQKYANDATAAKGLEYIRKHYLQARLGPTPTTPSSD